jgi:hypothetical protein
MHDLYRKQWPTARNCGWSHWEGKENYLT